MNATVKRHNQTSRVEVDDDVFMLAQWLQKCKERGYRAGQIVINVTPEGVINLDQVFWYCKHSQKIVLTK